MSVITISRGSYSKGKEIAEELGRRLDYQCISREILIEASEQFNIPEIKLVRAVHDAPSILDRFTHGKEKYIAYIRKALLEHVMQDNIVYHGLAGHFFLQQIPHVFKVRIIANMKDRVAEEMRRENISEEQAWELLKKDDAERRKWALALFGIDTWDANLYDMVLQIGTLTVNDAADLLVDACHRQCFKSTETSQEFVAGLLLAAKVQVALIDAFPAAKVSSIKGVVHVTIAAPFYLAVSRKVHSEGEITRKIHELVSSIEGIKAVKTHIIPSSFQ